MKAIIRLRVGVFVLFAISAINSAKAERATVDSPLVIVGETDLRGVTAVRLNSDRYEAIKAVDEALIRGFALSDRVAVDLLVSRFDVLTDDAQLIAASGPAQSTLAKPDVVLLSGSVLGDANSTVYLALAPTGSQGIIERNGRTFVVSSGPFGQSLDTIIYDRDALPSDAIQWHPFDCLTDVINAPLGQQQFSSADSVTIAQGPCRVAEVAIETDHEFLRDLFGSNTTAAAAYVVQLTGAVSEIFTRDVNTRVKISFMRLWESSSDPWTQGDTVNQLFEFIDFWEANMGHVSRNDAHFYSGRGLGGGVAYLPGLCQGEFAYALSANLGGFFPYPLQDKHNQNWDPFVVAHEFGHNFGAPHTHDMNPPVDQCAGGACGVDGTIMSYCHLCPGGMTNILLRFHERTINETILPYLDQAPCNLTQHPDCNPVNCELVQQVKAKCKSRSGKVTGTVLSQLAEGTELTLSLNGASPQTVTTNAKGRAKATWNGAGSGPQEVCIVECGTCGTCNL